MLDIKLMIKYIKDCVKSFIKKMTCDHENAVTTRSDSQHVSYCPDCDTKFYRKEKG